jgi:hypothetical protein
MPHPPKIIAYRSPVTRDAKAQRILNELITSESLGWAAAIGKLALGVPLCLLGPLLITVVAKVIEFKWGADVLPGFLLTWFLVTAVLVPLLMWLERRTHGEFFSDAVRGETSPFDASSYGEYQLQSAKVLGTAYTELALLGPRLLWAFIDWIMQRPGADASVRATAAAIVVDLLQAGQGLAIRELIRPDRQKVDVLRAIKYLVSRDWVGTSRQGDRVWLSTPVRERLVAG